MSLTETTKIFNTVEMVHFNHKKAKTEESLSDRMNPEELPQIRNLERLSNFNSKEFHYKWV